MCHTCKPIRAYETIDTADKLNLLKAKAYDLVNEGVFTLLHDFGDMDGDFHETQFLCEDCGKVHILWLHTFLCRTGGEWRCVLPH